jgi:DNA (cytosine-5)-methyltransferase 1
MRLATLFSGIGAPEQGAMRVYGKDLEMVFACEWDKFARESFNANYHIAPEHFHKDVNDLDGTQYEGKVDVLVGGSPCQAFSIAGLRNGTDDVRGQLIYQYIRVVEEVKAPVIVYENVKGMMSIDNGNTIKEFVQALRDIGYHCHYEVINTKDYGIPQNRERIFLVGFLDSEAYHCFSFAPKQKLEKRLKDILESDVDEKYYLSDKAIDGFKVHTQRMEERGNGFKFAPTNGDTIASSITTRAGGRPDDNFINVLGLLDCKGTDQIRRVYGVDGIAATLTTMQGGNQEPKIQVTSATKCGYETATTGDSINLSVPNSKTRRGRVGKQVAQTLDTQCNQAVVSNRIRKLTPRECLRLQDFPDTFVQTVSDSQLYKQAGNSMSVNVLEMIFRQIDKAKVGESTYTLF